MTSARFTSTFSRGSRSKSRWSLHFTSVMPAVTYQSPQNSRDSSRNHPDMAIRRLKVVASERNFLTKTASGASRAQFFEHFGRRDKVTRPCGLTIHAVITPSGQFLPKSRACHALSAAAQITPCVTREILPQVYPSRPSARRPSARRPLVSVREERLAKARSRQNESCLC